MTIQQRLNELVTKTDELVALVKLLLRDEHIGHDAGFLERALTHLDRVGEELETAAKGES